MISLGGHSSAIGGGVDTGGAIATTVASQDDSELRNLAEFQLLGSFGIWRKGRRLIKPVVSLACEHRPTAHQVGNVRHVLF